MNHFYKHNIKIVYPISIFHKGKRYLTLYYYTESSDSILHTDSNHILYFQSSEELELFCKENQLQTEGTITHYNFDLTIRNPIDYQMVLDNWNLLNTIANTLGMFFEGDRTKYNSLYELLFRMCTPADPIPSTYKIGKKHFQLLLRVFRKKDRFFNRFERYQNPRE